MAAVNCDPAALVKASACLSCLTPGQHRMVQTYLLAVAAGGSTDPKVLLPLAKCFTCLTPGEQEIVQIYLECKIAGGT